MKKIETIKLTKKLELLKQIINENDFSGLSKYFYFKNNSFYSYNGRIFISFKTDYELDDFCVPAEFFELIKKIKTKKIKIEQEDNKLIIRSGKTIVELVTNNELIDKINFDYKDKDFKKLPDNFVIALKLTLFCVNRNSTDASGYLTINNNFVYSTNKYKVIRYKLDMNIKNLMLPYDCIEFLVKADVNQYQETDNYYIFKNDNNVIIGILKSSVDGFDYEKYNDIFESENNVKIILPQEIKNNVELSEIFTNEEEKEIEFVIKDKNLICKSKNDIGIIQSQISIDTDLEMSFFIHPLFLLEILHRCNEMQLKKDIVIFKQDDFCYFFRIKL